MTKEEMIILKNKLYEYKDISEEERNRVLQAIENGQEYGFNTGYASIDRPWLQYIGINADNYAKNIPLDKTVWDIIEEKLKEYYDVPAIEFFKKEISREDFVNNVYTWARTFRAMGVDPDEVVPIYGPFTPDICAMTLSLNMIGASPYFLKLAISPEALEKETRNCKVAVVYDGMWKNVAHEFSKDKFKKIIVSTITNDMPSPKKEIVSFMNFIQAKKNKASIPNEKKYIWVDEAKNIANYYTGDVKVPFVPNRTSFITSSSGTTIGGIVKGPEATNESAISQLYMGDATDIQYFPGDRCLNHFPPTASTSLNLLYLIPLYRGLTVVLDPRVSEKAFFNQITKLYPNIAVNTSSMWEAFFNKVENEMKMGKTFDFSYAKVWVVGGEGTDIKKFLKWQDIMHSCNSERGVLSGYGCSEIFACGCTEKTNARVSFSKDVMSVGIPYAGLNVGVFDDNGNELKYNQRGNLGFNGNAVMKRYHNNPELTEKALQNSYYKTEDLAEIDDNGFIYIWGRESDKIVSKDNKKVYLFDISNAIKKHAAIDDAIVINMPTNENRNTIVAHIVWNKDYSNEEKSKYLNEINTMVESIIPDDVELAGYHEYEIMLPYSPTTLKKDKNFMIKQLTGYIQTNQDGLFNVEFTIDKDGCYHKTIISMNKQLILKS